MTGQPPDADEVARYVQAALAAEHDVMKCGCLHPSPADTTTLGVANKHVLPNITGDQAEAFEFELRTLPSIHNYNARRHFNDQ